MASITIVLCLKTSYDVLKINNYEVPECRSQEAL